MRSRPGDTLSRRTRTHGRGFQALAGWRPVIVAGLRLYAGAALLVGIAAYIALVVLDRNHSWMHPETFEIKDGILSQGTGLSLQDVALAFDARLFEGGPRVGRPLSSYFEIVDTRLRAWLWRWVLPHPSLSLTFVFTLGVSPLLLWTILRHLDVERATSLFAVALYVGSPSFYSLVVMNFRPAKAMTNFSLLLVAVLALRLAERQRVEGETSALRRGFCALMAVMMISFLWDETALVAYVVPVVFAPRLFSPARLALYAVVPVVMAIGYFGALPMISELTGHDWPSYYRYYRALAGVRWLLQPETWTALRQNFWLLVVENTALFWPALAPSVLGKVVLGLNLAATAVFVGGLGRSLFREHVRRALVADGAVVRVGTFVVALGVTHGVLMGMVVNKIWGPYWYGVYWQPFWTVFVAVVADRLRLHRVTAVFATVAVVAVAYTFPFLNNASKGYHFCPFAPLNIREVFLGTQDRFSLRPTNIVDRHDGTERY